jgi:hypothetical protein
LPLRASLLGTDLPLLRALHFAPLLHLSRPFDLPRAFDAALLNGLAPLVTLILHPLTLLDPHL